MTQATDRLIAEPAALVDAFASLEAGARILEDAYRELWSAHQAQRGAAALETAERLRDLRHDVRNPLGGVRGLAVLLARELDARPTSPKASRLLQSLLSGLDAVETALDRGTSAAETHCDAGEIAEETAGLALAEATARGTDVHFSITVPRGLDVPMAPARLRALLANLLGNAAEACGPRGCVALRIDSSLDAVTITVEDDGQGLPRIPDADLFRRGFSTKGEGRGRGLALVDELVTAHGGTFFLGRKSRGATARVRLPRGVRS